MIRWWAYEVRFEQEVYAKTMARSSSKYRCNPTESESTLMTTSMRILRDGRDDGQTMAYHQPTCDGRVVQEGTLNGHEKSGETPAMFNDGLIRAARMKR